MNIIEMMNGKYEFPISRASLLDDALAERTAAASDDLNVIKAVTITLRPQLHKLDPRASHKMLRDIIQQHVCRARKKIFIEIHTEFTQACVIHWHGTFIGRSTTIAKLCSRLRRDLGFLYIKTPTNLTGWIEYTEKENSFPAKYYYN